MRQITFSELTLEDLTFKNLIIVIRFILLSLLFVLIYFVIWHFIYKIGNEDIMFWGTIICLVIGWKRLKYYENMVYANKIRRSAEGENIRAYPFKINTFLKILLTPIVIPLMLSAYVCDFITERIYKNNISKKENIIDTKYKSNNYNSKSYDYSDLEEEYYCEICLKRITEEDYELYDCMCKDCFFEKEDCNI